jgi:uncharacterized SAM-binding protein YcdF (DUF218 family)
MRRSPLAWRWLAFGAAAGLALWLGGLAWFIHGSLSLAGDRAGATDAIVVLTGGRLRLETGLGLLGAGKARKLFVSGVNPRVDRIELERVVGPLPDLDSGRIILGYAADNTQGNARETAEWMRQQGYRSLRLVTSWYHMRRSLAEFEAAMPQARIVAEPVFAGRAEPGPWSGWLEVAALTVSEYNKYLVTLLRHRAGALWPSAAARRPMASAEVGAAASGPRR